MKSFPVHKAVLFDLDGVVALTEQLKARSHLEALRRLGGQAKSDDYLPLMGGAHESVRAGMIAVSGENIDPQEYTRQFREIYQELVEHELVIRPGIIELVSALKKDGFRLAVVSSSTGPVVRHVIEQAGLIELIDVLVSADDVQRKKPSPDPYLKAMAEIQVDPENCIVFEDTNTGLLAAAQAGARAIAVRHSLNSLQDFSPAVTVLDDLESTEKVMELVQSTLK